MGERVTIRLDDEVYDEVLAETDDDRPKGRVVNERLRTAYEMQQPGESLGDTLLPQFGQSLFVVGFVLALLTTALVQGVGVSLVGLALMVGSKVDEYSSHHDVPAHVALVRVLGA